MNLWNFSKLVPINGLKVRLDDYINLIRLNRPAGIYPLLFPCLFGCALAYKSPDAVISVYRLIYFMLLFAIGSVVMRSAGCIINDIFDQKFDILVSRTRNRALVAGKVTKKQAIILLFVLLLFGLLILLQFNQKVVLLGFFSLFLAVIYPLTKRITYFPQVFLGITYNIGVLMASLAILQKINISAIILYVTTIIWTVIYDTIYAYQDIEDDLKIGVKSTAVKFASSGKKIMILLNIAMFSGFILLGKINDWSLYYYFLALIANGYLLFGLIKCDLKNPKDCSEAFKSTLNFSLIILTAIIFG